MSLPLVGWEENGEPGLASFSVPWAPLRPKDLLSSSAVRACVCVCIGATGGAVLILNL